MHLLENKITEGMMKVTHRFRGDVTIAKRRGVRWALSKDNFIETRLLNFRYYESEQLAFCQDFLERRPVDFMIDIGANFGLYSLHFARHAKIKRIMAFEPVRQNYERFCDNIRLNKRHDCITPYRLALSDVPGEFTMHVDRKSTGLSRFSEIGQGQRFYSETVKTAVFDSLFPIQGVTAFIKCDTEGHELKVLTGMRNFLAANKVFAQVESFDSAAKPFLESLGYKQFGKIGDDAYFCNF